jgi:hypothetical protein
MSRPFATVALPMAEVVTTLVIDAEASDDVCC